ncbi:hypothetical protein BN1708_012022 [Verticillium longisporum]|uniref:FAM192A/Fyv6 N-terminal domain-containing protein n=2 Tax=Verticillium longisporum TaxID=100787 RepID=A0A0G4L5N8_VERLO|nr:hypothetical protein BN1708_012022 [Verticillium longisporum]
MKHSNCILHNKQPSVIKMKSTTQSLALLAALLQSLHVVAQSSTYTTSIVTTCITVTPSIATPTQSSHVPDTAVTVFVPDCFQCDCAVCVHTTRLTTTLAAFCLTGIVDRPYVVEHVYSGMSAIPTMTDPTFILAGFTTAVETCTSCGVEPITATLTFPNGGRPYVPEMTHAAAPSRGIKHGSDDWVAAGLLGVQSMDLTMRRQPSLQAVLSMGLMAKQTPTLQMLSTRLVPIPFADLEVFSYLFCSLLHFRSASSVGRTYSLNLTILPPTIESAYAHYSYLASKLFLLWNVIRTGLIVPVIMSSRFVSGGKIDAETGEVVTPDASDKNTAQETRSKGNAEWEAVQRELDAERRRREEARAKAVEGGEKSLYDVLQANKAAKEAAFEEANKIRNQFRALDDDEIDFLDEVREKKRMEEERVREETTEGLKAFRERQQVQDKTPAEEESRPEDDGTDEWAVGRKRKRERGSEVKGLVRRRVSEGGKGDSKTGDGGKSADSATAAAQLRTTTSATAATTKPTSVSPPPPKVGLVAYDSDDDE